MAILTFPGGVPADGQVHVGSEDPGRNYHPGNGLRLLSAMTCPFMDRRGEALGTPIARLFCPW